MWAGMECRDGTRLLCCSCRKGTVSELGRSESAALTLSTQRNQHYSIINPPVTIPQGFSPANAAGLSFRYPVLVTLRERGTWLAFFEAPASMKGTD
jgi:hypothetical protein